MSRRTWGWIMAIVAIAAVCAVAVLVWNQGEQNAEAHRKAVELKARAAALGMRTPSVRTLQAIYGDDGGAICATANSDMARALLVSGIGRQGEVNGRPVVVDRQVLAWHYLVLQVYCPEKAADFRQFLRDLATENIVSD